MFVPFASVLMSVYKCHAGEAWGRSDWACYGPAHLTVLAAVTALWPAFLAFALVVSSVFLDRSYTSDGLTARAHGRVGVAMITIKTSLTLLFTVAADADPWLLHGVVVAAGLVWLFLWLRYLPSYTQWVNAAWAGFGGVFLWAGAAAALARALGDPARGVAGYVFFLGAPTAAYCGWAAAAQRWRAYGLVGHGGGGGRTASSYDGGGSALLTSSSSLTTLRTPWDVELAVRFILRDVMADAQAGGGGGGGHGDGHGDGHGGDHSADDGGGGGGGGDTMAVEVDYSGDATTSAAGAHQPPTAPAAVAPPGAVARAKAVVRAGRLLAEALCVFPGSPVLELVAANFARCFHPHDPAAELGHLCAGLAKEPAMDVRFLLSQARHQLEEALARRSEAALMEAATHAHAATGAVGGTHAAPPPSTAAATATTRLGIIERVQFAKLTSESMQHGLAARVSELRFWGELRQPRPDAAALHAHAEAMSTAVQRATRAFDRLLAMAPHSVEVLQTYAVFLQEVRRETGRAGELFDAADRLVAQAEAAEDGRHRAAQAAAAAGASAAQSDAAHYGDSGGDTRQRQWAQANGAAAAAGGGGGNLPPPHTAHHLRSIVSAALLGTRLSAHGGGGGSGAAVAAAGGGSRRASLASTATIGGNDAAAISGDDMSAALRSSGKNRRASLALSSYAANTARQRRMSQCSLPSAGGSGGAALTPTPSLLPQADSSSSSGDGGRTGRRSSLPTPSLHHQLLTPPPRTAASAAPAADVDLTSKHRRRNSDGMLPPPPTQQAASLLVAGGGNRTTMWRPSIQPLPSPKPLPFPVAADSTSVDHEPEVDAPSRRHLRRAPSSTRSMTAAASTAAATATTPADANSSLRSLLLATRERARNQRADADEAAAQALRSQVAGKARKREPALVLLARALAALFLVAAAFNVAVAAVDASLLDGYASALAQAAAATGRQLAVERILHAAHDVTLMAGGVLPYTPLVVNASMSALRAHGAELESLHHTLLVAAGGQAALPAEAALYASAGGLIILSAAVGTENFAAGTVTLAVDAQTVSFGGLGLQYAAKAALLSALPLGNVTANQPDAWFLLANGPGALRAAAATSTALLADRLTTTSARVDAFNFAAAVAAAGAFAAAAALLVAPLVLSVKAHVDAIYDVFLALPRDVLDGMQWAAADQVAALHGLTDDEASWEALTGGLNLAAYLRPKGGGPGGGGDDDSRRSDERHRRDATAGRGVGFADDSGAGGADEHMALLCAPQKSPPSAAASPRPSSTWALLGGSDDAAAAASAARRKRLSRASGSSSVVSSSSSRSVIDSWLAADVALALQGGSSSRSLALSSAGGLGASLRNLLAVGGGSAGPAITAGASPTPTITVSRRNLLALLPCRAGGGDGECEPLCNDADTAAAAAPLTLTRRTLHHGYGRAHARLLARFCWPLGAVLLFYWCCYGLTSSALRQVDALAQAARRFGSLHAGLLAPNHALRVAWATGLTPALTPAAAAPGVTVVAAAAGWALPATGAGWNVSAGGSWAGDACSPTAVAALLGATRDTAARLQGDDDVAVYGSVAGGVPSALGLLPSLSALMLDDACTSPGQPADCNGKKAGADGAGFYNGLNNGGLQSAVGQYLRALTAVQSQRLRALEDAAAAAAGGSAPVTSCPPVDYVTATAPLALQDALAHRYLPPALAQAQGDLAAAAASSLAALKSGVIGLCAASVGGLALLYAAVVRPAVRRMDADIKRTRGTLLLFPAEVLAAVAAFTGAVSEAGNGGADGDDDGSSCSDGETDEGDGGSDAGGSRPGGSSGGGSAAAVDVDDATSFVHGH
jgi:hypothetical protein